MIISNSVEANAGTYLWTVEKAFHHTPKRFGFVMPVKTGIQ